MANYEIKEIQKYINQSKIRDTLESQIAEYLFGNFNRQIEQGGGVGLGGRH